MKKGLIAAVVLFIVIASVAYFLGWKNYSPGSALGVKDVPSYRAPDYFPNLPIDSKASIKENYNVTTGGGEVQATRVVDSSADVSLNFAFYKNFIAQPENGWVPSGEINNPSSPSHKALFAKNSGGYLSIDISAGSAPNSSVINLTYLYTPVK